MAKIISNNLGNKFVAEAIGLNVIAEAKSAVLSSIFGVGVSYAEKNQLVNQGNKESRKQFSEEDVQQNLNNSYSPDAIPDGNGSFIQSKSSSLWNGKFSSSLAGMPVMCSLKFIGTSYIALDGTTITIPDTEFENVLISVKRSKNIEKTTVSGSNTGTVKEYIGSGDHIISIRIITTASEAVTELITGRNQDGAYPIENMEALSLILDAPIALQVESWFLNKVHGINYIVIDDGTDISQVEGEYETQRIVIPALSDNPLIITVAS